MRELLTAPLFISARLMAAVKLAEHTPEEATLHVAPIAVAGPNSRMRWRYVVEVPGEDIEFEDADLEGPEDSRAALANLCSFLGAAGEAYAYRMRNPATEPENLDLFPDPVNEWAYMVEDELSLMVEELEG